MSSRYVAKCDTGLTLFCHYFSKHCFIFSSLEKSGCSFLLVITRFTHAAIKDCSSAENDEGPDSFILEISASLTPCKMVRVPLR